MSTIHATGVSVRHAISRALATANLTPREATYRVLTAKARPDGRGGILRGEVSVRILRPDALSQLPPHEWVGWVNPDGAHPLMAVAPSGRERAGIPELLWMDVYPVTWDAWLRVVKDSLPEGTDALCPVTGITLDQARAYTRAADKLLPSTMNFSSVWGDDRLPWGQRPDPKRGRLGRPRFDQIPAVGSHPPGPYGIFDLGAWLWHWLDDGTLAGGTDENDPGFGLPATPQRGPVGFRCVLPFEHPSDAA